MSIFTPEQIREAVRGANADQRAMMNTPIPNEVEKIIEELAMAVTHSKQGEYSKNEAFVREKIDALLLAQKKHYQKNNK